MIENQSLIAYQPISFPENIPKEDLTFATGIMSFALLFLAYRSFQIRNKNNNLERVIRRVRGQIESDEGYSPFLSLSNLGEFMTHERLINPFEIFPDANLFLNLYKGDYNVLQARKFDSPELIYQNFICSDFDRFQKNFMISYGFEKFLPAKEIQKLRKVCSQGILPQDTRLGYHHLEWTNLPKQTKNGTQKEKNIISAYTECVMPDTNRAFFLKVANIAEGEIPPKSTIFTGSCIGSIGFANAVTESGRKLSLTKRSHEIDEKITDLQFDESMSVYEIANIIESSSLISSMIIGNSNFDKVVINLPSGNYYLYILEAFESGFLSSEQILEYFDKVDEKEKILLNAFTKRIKKQCGRDIQIESESNIDSVIKSKIRSYVNSSNVSQLGFICELKESLKSPILVRIIESTDVYSYQDLLNVDYVSLYLDRQESTVFVENHDEQFLLSNTKKLAKKLKFKIQNLHSAIYIFPRVVANIEFSADNSFKNKLYNAEGKLKLSVFKDILRFYRREFDFSISEHEYIDRYFDQIYDRFDAKKDGVELHRRLTTKLGIIGILEN